MNTGKDPGFCPLHWRLWPIFWGAVTLGVFYLAIAVLFSFFSWKSVAGLGLGIGYTLLNAWALSWTIRRFAWEGSGAGRLYGISYTLRMLGAGLCLAAAFQWLDPFAALIPMISPRITYFFLALRYGEKQGGA